jgi:alkylated DNA repair dioxygenase AlkB
MGQLSLFNRAPTLSFDASFAQVERIVLENGAWLELQRNWLAADALLFDVLRERVPWKDESRLMYDRTVAVPRQHAALRDGGAIHPILAEMRGALDARYATRFERLSLALYRNGDDSVAWHGDYVARRMPQALVATVSIGAPRKFALRPKGGGPSIAFSLGWGDLIVMGGSCQRTYEHAVPKVAHADPRIAIMYRPKWKT